MPQYGFRVAWAVCMLALWHAATGAAAQEWLAPPPPENHYGVRAAQPVARPPSSQFATERLPQSAPPPQTDASQPETTPADRSVSERLGELEKQLAAQAEAEADESAEAKKTPSLRITGRIHLDYWSFAEDSPGIGFFENPATGVDPEDRIFFRRLRIAFLGDIFETMLYKLEVDFNNPSEPEMKDNYLGFKELPLLQTVLLGYQKRPLGLDHLNSSRFNIFIERPLVVEAFNEDARRLGLASYGVSQDEAFNWTVGVYSLENPVDDGRYIGDSLQLGLNTRLSASPWYDESSGGRGYLHLAVANMAARPDGDADPLDTNRNEGRFRTRGELRSDNRWIDTGRIAGADWFDTLGLETILNLGPLQIVSEYQNTWLDRDDGSALFFHGAYVYAAYFLTGEHQPYDRESGTIDCAEPFENFFLVERCRGGVGAGWGAWQVAARYSYLDLTDEDIRGGVEHNVTLALNWLWTSHSKLQFNAIYADIRDHAPVGGFTSGHFTGIGSRFMVDF